METLDILEGIRNTFVFNEPPDLVFDVRCRLIQDLFNAPLTYYIVYNAASIYNCYQL